MGNEWGGGEGGKCGFYALGMLFGTWVGIYALIAIDFPFIG